jgi:V8-like Glu-specific endopeptidase
LINRNKFQYIQKENIMRKCVLSILLVLVISTSLVTNASAISNGESDGNQHPMVGAMFADFDGDGIISGFELICSGSYAGSSRDGLYAVFLTAGHCLAFTPSIGITQLYVSFDNEVLDANGPAGLIPSVAFYWDPAFGHDLGDLHDLGVILLPAGSVVGIDPVQLPPKDYLEGLRQSGAVNNIIVENAGYGVVPVWKQPGGTQFGFDGVRRTSTSPVKGLTKSNVLYSMNNDATGLGGVCFGDSGSPQFIAGTRMIISTTSGGDGNCRSNNYNYRLDTSVARNFLGQFLLLP